MAKLRTVRRSKPQQLKRDKAAAIMKDARPGGRKHHPNLPHHAKGYRKERAAVRAYIRKKAGVTPKKNSPAPKPNMVDTGWRTPR